MIAVGAAAQLAPREPTPTAWPFRDMAEYRFNPPLKLMEGL